MKIMMDVKYNLFIHDTQTNNRERNVNTFKEYNLYKFCYMMLVEYNFQNDYLSDKVYEIIYEIDIVDFQYLMFVEITSLYKHENH